MPQGLDHARIVNAILHQGIPLVTEMEVETTTEFCPGKLVKVDTAEYQCEVAGDEATTVLGVADCPSDKRLQDYYTASAGGAVTDTFDAGDQIRILHGPIIVKVIAKSGEDIDVGERVVAAANGMVKAFDADGPEDVVGVSMEDTGGALATCDWLLIKLLI
jgi:hypothetical protein